MKRYELKKIADGGLLYLEESDITEVRPRKGDALYPVEVELRNRDAYRLEEGFAYNARRGTVTVKLSARQAKELIEQDRAATGKDFCTDCFDFGASVDPEQCARCNVIISMHRAGWGDLRKIRIPLPRPQGYGLPVALLLAILAFWWALCQWSGAAAEADRARQELEAVRRFQSPPPKVAR